MKRLLPCVAPLILATSLLAQTRPQAPAAKESAFGAYIHSQIASTLDDLQKDNDTKQAAGRLESLFELVISRAGDKEYDLVRDTDFALRLTEQLNAVPAAKRPELLTWLRAHDDLARTLAFTIKDGDNIRAVYGLIDSLRNARPKQIDTYANLATALAVVYDRPLVRHINENTVTAPDPLAIFDYYVANENAMAFGIKNVPPELLIYVVDTTTSIDEMRWALAHYAHDPMVGRQFFAIKYDVESFTKGTPKKVDSVPYNLPDILQYGGVCADQAYFAVSVGKAIGVPTCYTHGASAETSHAWVGFLQAQGNQGAWNFDVGRYEEFRGVRGLVEDPQTREQIPDAFVSFTAEMIHTKPQDRQTALALSDAAAYLAAIPGNHEFATQALPADIANPTKPLRQPGVGTELDLLRQSLAQNPGNAEAWYIVAHLAGEGKLSLDQKKQWSDELLKRAGQRYPDFALAVVTPMIESVEDPGQQNNLWNAAFERFQSRFDLAAFIRIEQAKLWKKQKDYQKEGLCYYDVINRYVNAGPFILTALSGAEDALRNSGTPDRIPALYQLTWSRCTKPANMASEFMTQSNWYRVGRLLEQRLLEAHQDKQAADVESALNGATGSPR